MSSHAATADWRWIAEKPQLVKEIERPKTAEPSKYRQYAAIANSLAVGVDQHWDSLDERIRHGLRVFAACTLEPQHAVSGWAVLQSRVSMTIAFYKDREAVTEYLTAIARARRAILGSIERENSDFQKVLISAVTDVTNGSTGRSTMTAGEASDFIRSI
jgi:hypothetical protein